MATTRLHPDAPIEALLNRELSWLDLNGRVLELAADPNEPLLERVKFCSIFSNNLDEFFMVRVAGLLDQVVSGVWVRSRDGRTSQQTLDEIRARVLELSAQQAQLWRDQLCPRSPPNAYWSAASTTPPTTSGRSSRTSSRGRSIPS